MIEGQKQIFNLLKQNKQNNRLSHAYLFYGDVGVGKKEMAYALAAMLYCPNDGCLECPTCKSIIEGKNLNVEYVGILDNKKLISKEQITELQEQFSKTSLVDGYRVYIVDGIDTASISAQNSLLKFIEEPINNTPTIGIFIATELANVLQTIISRCSLIHFKAIDTLKLIELIKLNDIADLDASLTALLTNNIDSALDLVDSEEYGLAKEIFLNFLNLNNSKEAVLFYLNYGYKLTDNIVKIFFKWLIQFYLDVFKVESKESLILTALYDKINIYSKKDNDKLRKDYEDILNLYSKLNYNVSGKNIFHELITDLF